MIPYRTAITLKKITTVVLIALMPLLLRANGQNCCSGSNTYDNLQDIFYVYYKGNREDARRSLDRMSGTVGKEAEGLVNRGLIDQIEGERAAAEGYYKKSLDYNPRMGLIYLCGLYGQREQMKYIALLEKARTDQSARWIDYEKAVSLAKIDKTAEALSALDAAIKNGFSSEVLLNREPAFDRMRNSKPFADLVRLASRKGTSDNLGGLAAREENLLYAKRRYALSSDLKLAQYFDGRRELGKSEELLLKIIGAKTSFMEKSVALYWLARIKVRQRRMHMARRYLEIFTNHLYSSDADPSGYKAIMQKWHKDIIRNDRYLRSL